MSQRVDFYIISNRVSNAKLKLASRLCNKLCKLNKKALVYTSDANESQLLDDLMWQYNDTSFVPHEVIQPNSIQLELSPVHISHTTELPQKYDVLINLNGQIPEHHNQFERIAELVSNDDQDKQLARQRYKVYMDNSSELSTHNIEL